MDTTRHAGKTAIVTGAGNGIGRATVLRMAREGARVIGCDVNVEAVEHTRELVSAEGLDVELLIADVTNQDDVDRVVAAAGPDLDIVANVAGVMDHFLPLGEMDDATWERVMGVNVTGVMRLSRAAIPVFEARGQGVIVTVASKASLGAGAAGTAYATSKHAVIGLVRSIAYLYGPKGIRSNAVLPGAVATEIGTTASPSVQWAFDRAMLAMASAPQAIADSDQIATAISWLASDEASNVNGALLSDDGGWATS
ncbi:MAG: SDR family oxidoreductase [Candidatus Nanopelagicales bacterium]|nr:SDR family oxidoreductase [Candidatus Nanopelagicales bacterium]